MRLMPRDRELLKRLAAARWLSTAQAAMLCFPGLSPEMPRRRIRLLRGQGYVTSRQNNRMAHSLHSLGPLGKELLLSHGWKRPIRLERALPRNLEHFVGINDIRVAMVVRARQGEFDLGFFYASWELQQLGWTSPLVPDAACHLARAGAEKTLFFEYDRGGEAPSYIGRTKFENYADGLPGFGTCHVVLIVETRERQDQLRRYASSHRARQQILIFLRKEFLHSGNAGGFLI
jgi:hypothetical protein